MIARYSDARLPTPHGEFRVVVYRTGEPGGADATALGLAHEEHVAMVLGDVSGGGVLARCLLHENDHLTGKLLVDFVGPLKRQMIKKKLLKAKGGEPADVEA